MYSIDKTQNICKWIGDNEFCRSITILGRSYCEKHNDRMFVSLYPEMADFILDKELSKNAK